MTVYKEIKRCSKQRVFFNYQRKTEDLNMTEQELRKLKRADLIELLISQIRENDYLTKQNAKLSQMLEEREIKIDEAGSIAEAAIAINNVFADAQAAADQYLENMHALNRQQEDAMLRREKESRRICESQIAEAREYCKKLEDDTKMLCDKMVSQTMFELKTQREKGLEESVNSTDVEETVEATAEETTVSGDGEDLE